MQTKKQIKKIRKMAAGLQTDDLVRLVEQLSDLQVYTAGIRREVNKVVQNLIKAEADGRAKFNTDSTDVMTRLMNDPAYLRSLLLSYPETKNKGRLEG